MTAPRRIAVVSVARSDYGHLRSVLREIQAAPDLRLLLLVSGTHLVEAFGATVREIEADGWPIAARIPALEPDDSPAAIARSLGAAVAGFAETYAQLRPDLLVVLGDRFEMLAAAAAALPFALPVAHVHGGEVTEGAFDNQIRHAITKLAHVHFAAAESSARRIAAMGEEPWRIHTVGAPGLDRLRDAEPFSREAVARALDLSPSGSWILVTYHPVTLEYRDTAWQVEELLAALDKVEGAVVITYPNADTAHRVVVERLEEAAARAARIRLVRTLGERLYLSLLSHADVMVGNSSSGIIEAPSLALPVVNVGTRQAGRLRGANVIDVDIDREAIRAGIEAARSPAFRERIRTAPNPYGDGQAAPRIVRVLRDVPLGDRLLRKRAT